MEFKKFEFRKMMSKQNHLRTIHLLCNELGLTKNEALWYVICKGLSDIKKRKDYEENKTVKELK